MSKDSKCSETLLPSNTEPNCMIFHYNQEIGKTKCSQCMPYYFLTEDGDCIELPGNLIVGESPCIFGEFNELKQKINCKICLKGFPSSMRFGNECIPFTEFNEDHNQIEEEELKFLDSTEEAKQNPSKKTSKHFQYDSSDLVSMRTENCLWGSFGEMGPECMRCIAGYVSVDGHCRKEEERMDKGCAYRGTTRFDEEGCASCNLMEGYFAIGDGFCKQFYEKGLDQMRNLAEDMMDYEKINETVHL